MYIKTTDRNYGSVRCGVEIVEGFAVACRRNDINLMSASTPLLCSARR